jgi:mannose-6-phosphate isomerase
MNTEKTENQRPWGYYQVLSDEPDHKVKLIVVYPGRRLTRNDEQLHLRGGESVDIPREAIHRVMNPGTEDMTFIEVQTGDYFGEDDIERLEDDFGRA